MGKNTFAVSIGLILMLVGGAVLGSEKQGPAYPKELLGVWQGGDVACRLPGNLDSDSRIEIKPDKLLDYEQWNEPKVVLQISRKPKAWKIKSRLHIDEDAMDQYEVFLLSGADDGVLTVVDSNTSMTYARCR